MKPKDKAKLDAIMYSTIGMGLDEFVDSMATQGELETQLKVFDNLAKQNGAMPENSDLKH